MPFNGAGVFTLVAGNPVVTGTTISSTVQNNTMSDIANNGLSNALTKDGQTVATGNQPMGGFRHTGVGNAVGRTDYAAAGQVQDSSLQWLSAVSGADTITATTTPGITAYATGQAFRYTSAGANTITNPTINISAVGAKTLLQADGTALWVGAIISGATYEIVYDGTAFRIVSGQLKAQYLESTNAGFAASTGVIYNIGALTLPAGEWDVTGNVFFLLSGGSSSALLSSVNNVTGTHAAAAFLNQQGSANAGATSGIAPVRRFSLTVSTTIYLVGTCIFTGSATALGSIRANRIQA